MITFCLCCKFRSDFDLWSFRAQSQGALIIKQPTVLCNVISLLCLLSLSFSLPPHLPPRVCYTEVWLLFLCGPRPVLPCVHCIGSYLTQERWCSLEWNSSVLLNICLAQTPTVLPPPLPPVPPVPGHIMAFSLYRRSSKSPCRDVLVAPPLCVWSGCVGVFAVLCLVLCQWPYFEPAAAGAWVQPKIDGKPGQRSLLLLPSAPRLLLYLFFSSSLPPSLPFPTSPGRIYQQQRTTPSSFLQSFAPSFIDLWWCLAKLCSLKFFSDGTLEYKVFFRFVVWLL